MPLPKDVDIANAILDKYFKGEEWEKDYKIYTGNIKAICDYTNLNYFQVLNLRYSHFLLLAKDSWITGLMKSEQGREFLKTLRNLQVTEVEEDKIQAFVNR